jgi:hypothetical protein
MLSDCAWLPRAEMTDEGRLLAASFGEIPLGSLVEVELPLRICFFWEDSLFSSEMALMGDSMED